MSSAQALAFIETDPTDASRAKAHARSCGCARCRRYRFVESIVSLKPLLAQHLIRMVHRQADVEDIIQETFLHLLRDSAKCGSTYHSARAMILTVARRIAIDWIRKQQNAVVFAIPDLESLEVPDEGADVESLTQAAATLEDFARAASRLPPRCRQVFVLRKVYGLSQKEIALQLRITENTIEQHVSKALRRFPALLRDIELEKARG